MVLLVRAPVRLQEHIYTLSIYLACDRIWPKCYYYANAQQSHKAPIAQNRHQYRRHQKHCHHRPRRCSRAAIVYTHTHSHARICHELNIIYYMAWRPAKPLNILFICSTSKCAKDIFSECS